jgi:hypothetical protein
MGSLCTRNISNEGQRKSILEPLHVHFHTIVLQYTAPVLLCGCDDR